MRLLARRRRFPFVVGCATEGEEDSFVVLVLAFFDPVSLCSIECLSVFGWEERGRIGLTGFERSWIDFGIVDGSALFACAG